MKQSWKPGTMIYPLPAVLVSCGNTPQRRNLITVAWTGTVCTNPAMCYISVRPERHSYQIIKEEMQFTINLTTKEMARAVDWCGVKSGRDYDKWKETGLTPIDGIAVTCPYVEQAPISIECRVKEIIPLGSHHMFLAEVVNVLADEQYLDPKTGAFNMEQAHLISYNHGAYYTQGEKIGRFGWTVQKKNKKNK